MQKQKRNTILYWVFTAPIILMMLMPVWMFISQAPEVNAGTIHLGYPIYFTKIIVLAKLCGALALLQNYFKTIKEWAYAGYTFVLISASLSHYAVHDPISHTVTPVVVFGFLAASYYFWKQKA